MFCRSDEECGREMETENFGKRETDRWRHMVGAQLTGSGNATERRRRHAKFQVLTASFLVSEVRWGKTFCCSVSGSWHFKQKHPVCIIKH